MNVLLSGAVVAVAIAIVAAVVLNGAQKPAADAFATQSVRVGDAGHSWKADGTKKN